MDQEGFSGLDGRTTIFDYWTVDTLHRGYFDRRKLKRDEKQLEGLYLYVLNLVNAEKALREGEFFDLMYMNQHLAEKQYVFLRKAEDELMLVAVNFADADADCDIVIPHHAISYLGIEEKTYETVDLLSNEKAVLALKADTAVKVRVPANGGCVFKMKL
jgi:hypothetical protein